MTLTKYFYKHATQDCKDRIAIPELDRSAYMTPQYMEMFKEELDSIKLKGKVGLVYSNGASFHQSEHRVCKKDYSNSLDNDLPSPMAIKGLVAHMAHKYTSLFAQNDVQINDMEIVSNTCASSMYGIIKAKEMLDSGMDHVIVITEEKTSFDTVRIFHEHRISVRASDGFACAVFSKEGEGFEVSHCKKSYTYSNNPFLVTAEGYKKVYTASDMVKGHATGTEVNDKAEYEAFGPNVIGYKAKIGHSQGSSGLLELCMVADDIKLQGKVLCVASGLGGFYASCVLHK